MLFSPNKEQVLAFAGLAQSGKIVSQLAAEPEHDENALQSSARSLLITDPENISEIFDGTAGVELGLKTMCTLLKGQGMRSTLAQEMIRYLMSIDQLAFRLQRSPSGQAVVEQGLQELKQNFAALLEDEPEAGRQTEFDDFYTRIGTLYQKSLSQLSPQIIVRGAKGQLQDDISIARVRTALFAGVRAAYLWHQQGGRRWHLMFARNGYASLAQNLLSGR